MQLFSQQSAAAAARGAGGAGAPAPLKFHLKLGGFGSAVHLNDEGCAMDYSPYRSVSHPCFSHILLYALVPMAEVPLSHVIATAHT